MSISNKDTSLGLYDVRTGIFQHYDNNGVPFQSAFGQAAAKYNASFKRGHTIPNFHKRRADGELLPYTSFHKHIADGERSGHARTYNSQNWSTEDALPSMGAFYYTNDEILEAFAPSSPQLYTQMAASRIYDRGYDALTFFAELPETLRMLYNVARKLRDFKRKTSFKGGVDAFANNWLEARYGWRTLIYDINELNEVLEADWKRKRFTERAGTTYHSNSSTVETVSGYGGTISLTRAETVQVGVRGSVTADFVPEKWQFNPLVTGWEIVPYSFVVDWIVNIGQAIEAASFLASVSAYTASYGYVIDQEIDWEADGVNYSEGNSGTFNYSANFRSHTEVRIPTRVSVQPYYNLRLDANKIIDILSMVRQLVSGNKQSVNLQRR